MSLGLESSNLAAAATQSISSPGVNSGVANGGPARQLDRKADDADTAPKFGELLKNIQSKYGAQPEKAREIKKTLGKDDFLRIMITQMKNQDPTNPFKAEQMAAEMAQFTTVEQLKNMNESLGKMATANQPLEHMAMTGMIGKTVTVDRGRFPHQEGINDTLTFGLPSDAAKTTISLVDDHGETVFTKELGKLKAGENSFSWDGKKVNSMPAKAGTYVMRIEATDPQGQRINTEATAQARVIGVSFEGSEPVFLIGDAHQQQKVTMKNIVRIDDPGAAAGGALSPNRGIVSGGARAPQSFFSFKKGEGSSGIDPNSMPPDIAKAIASAQAALGAHSSAPQVSDGVAIAGPARPGGAPHPAQPAAPMERGFPNGLQDDKTTSDNQKGGEMR